jgi:AcrR family transcriptional regulator
MENPNRREREKNMREGEIISAAEKIFCLKGFDDTSMDEIAKEAQFTKRTLYQYFTNKEELYFAAVLKGLKSLFTYLQKAADNEQTGYLKLFQLSKCYYSFYKDFPETLRLINYIGYVKRKSQEDSQRKKDLLKFNNELFKFVAFIINEGKADGSIRNDLDSTKASFSLTFMMTGFFNQLSITGETFTENFELDLENFSFFSIDLLLNSIKNNKQE